MSVLWERSMAPHAGGPAGMEEDAGAVRPANLGDLVDPGHLDRFQDLLARTLRVVVEAGKFADPAVQVRKADGLRIDVGKSLGQVLGDLARIGPIHRDGPRISASP